MLISTLSIFTITPAGQEVALIALGIALVSSMVNKIVLDKELMKEMKEKMSQHQKEMKKAAKASDSKRSQELQGEYMKMLMEHMKHSFRPVMITFIPFILIFQWLRSTYVDVGTVATLFGFSLSWFAWYFICVMIISMIINRVLKAY